MKCIHMAMAIAALAVAPLSRAQVIYDNLGNDDPYATFSGWTIGFTTFESAIRFTAGSSLFLDYADLRLWNVSGSTTVNVAILADSGANTPGAILESTTAIAQTQSGAAPLSRAEFSNSLFLNAGTQYWLAVSPPDENSWSVWEFTGLPLGLRAWDTGEIGFSDAWTEVLESQEGGMRIFGGRGVSAVPEPSTYGVIGAFALGALIVARRSRPKK